MTSKKNYKFEFDTEAGIIYKIYNGNITVEDIKTSWDDAIKNKLLPENVKSFILDYSNARIAIPVKDHTKIVDYYNENINFFHNARLAIVTQNPEDVLIPSLIESKNEGYLSKPFYTLEAAIKWVKR